MWHKPCRTFHPWCPCIKTRCLSIPEVHPSYCQLRLQDFSPVPGLRPPRPASRRCGGYVAISLFTSWDLAASFPSTGVRPSHTALPPIVVAVPPSPPFPNPGVRPPPSPHAQPLRQLRYMAFSLLSRMSITRSTPTTPKLFNDCRKKSNRKKSNRKKSNSGEVGKK